MGIDDKAGASAQVFDLTKICMAELNISVQSFPFGQGSLDCSANALQRQEMTSFLANEDKSIAVMFVNSSLSTT